MRHACIVTIETNIDGLEGKQIIQITAKNNDSFQIGMFSWSLVTKEWMVTQTWI